MSLPLGLPKRWTTQHGGDNLETEVLVGASCSCLDMPCTYFCKSDEGNAFEAACVWEAHQIKVLNLSTVAPIISDLVFLYDMLLYD